MKITTGLFDHMVLQRNRRNRSDTTIAGETATTGSLHVRVTPGKGGWRAVGRVRRGQFRFRLEGLRSGGPYAIDLQVRQAGRVMDRLRVRDVLVGDVWLAGGQSNMQGCGRITGAAAPQAQVRAFYMDDQWRVARDPIHNLWECVDPVHIELSGGARPGVNRTHGVGPAVSFAQAMHASTGVPQGILACAHGGTSMAQWDPQRRDEGGRSLYGATIRRLRHNGGRVAGLIWYQGESDAHAEAAPLYTARMKALVAAVRRDTKDPRLPIVIVQIGRVIGWGNDTVVHWNSIQDQQRRLADRIRALAVVPCVDLALDDGIHIAGAESDRLGSRLAQAMAALRGSARAAKLPISLGRPTVEWDRVSGLGNVVVPFENVYGKLISGSRPVGFFIANPQAAIFDTVLDGTRVILRTSQSPAALQGAAVHYGQGIDPVCNITDEAGRSLPVFGPCILGLQRALTPSIRDLNVSVLLPGAGQLEALDFPSDLPAIPWRRKVFAGDMCDLHEEIGGAAPQDRLIYFRVRFTASEPMRLAALLGYDGPVKVWADGQLRFHDPQGTNPAVPHSRSVKFSVTGGAHDLLIALGTNSGKAWGIFLQLERLDVSQARLQKGPGHYAMPQLISPDNT